MSNGDLTDCAALMETGIFMTAGVFGLTSVDPLSALLALPTTFNNNNDDNDQLCQSEDHSKPLWWFANT